jgi:hypothetical protein
MNGEKRYQFQEANYSYVDWQTGTGIVLSTESRRLAAIIDSGNGKCQCLIIRYRYRSKRFSNFFTTRDLRVLQSNI